LISWANFLNHKISLEYLSAYHFKQLAQLINRSHFIKAEHLGVCTERTERQGES